MSDSDKKPAEFFSDEHKTSHIGALQHELEGYAAKAEGAKTRGNTDEQKAHENRAGQVKDELKRLGAEAKTPAQRANRR